MNESPFSNAMEIESGFFPILNQPTIAMEQSCMFIA